MNDRVETRSFNDYIFNRVIFAHYTSKLINTKQLFLKREKLIRKLLK